MLRKSRPRGTRPIDATIGRVTALIFCCEHDVADSRHGFFGRQNSAAYIIFLASYLVFALGKFPGLKIDRPGAAIIGAVAMFAAQIVHPAEALRFIDFATLVLLFSMMLIVGHLHLTGFFEWNAELGCAICAPHTCCRR